MFRSFLFVAALVFSTQLSMAQWSTKVDEDVLSDGKTAVMAGLISLNQALYLDCSSDGKLSLSYIEKSDWDDVMNNATGKMAIKVGNDEKIWLDVESYKHNALFIGFKNDTDAQAILKVVRSIRDGRGKLLFGIKFDVTDASFSGSTTLGGSTSAAKQFVQACRLSLDGVPSN